MDVKLGNFKFPDNVIPVKEFEQQPGRFGYIAWWKYLLMDSSGRFSVEADGLIERRPASSCPAILVRAVKGGGLEIELVGGDTLPPGVPHDKKSGCAVVPVKRITTGGRTYKKWDDELRYHPISTMPIGGRRAWFIERRQLIDTKRASKPVLSVASRAGKLLRVCQFGG